MKIHEISLRAKIVGAIGVMFLVVLSSIVAINYRDQRLYITAEVHHSAQGLADSVYNSMVYPMAVGDGKTVRQQMEEFKKSMKFAEVYVFGFDKLCAYSSEKEKVGTDLTKEIKSGGLTAELNQLLRDGKSSGRGHEEAIAGRHYLTILRPMVNESRCHHCHGASQAVLGGVMVRQNIDDMISNVHPTKAYFDS
jgi:methyl-accepting chemotaxis protein